MNGDSLSYFNESSARMHESGVIPQRLPEAQPPKPQNPGERHLSLIDRPELDPRLQTLAEDIAMTQTMVACSWFERSGELPADNPALSRQLEGYGLSGALEQLRTEQQERLRAESDFISDEIDQAFDAAWLLCREVGARISPATGSMEQK